MCSKMKKLSSMSAMSGYVVVQETKYVGSDEELKKFTGLEYKDFVGIG